MKKIKEIYESYDEFDRLLRHRMEFYINLRFIKENISNKKLRILDLGGGVGRYSIELTKMGHEVTLIDLASKNIKNALKLSKEKKVKIYKVEVGDALDLSNFKEDTFDVVLAMGPFYHIQDLKLRIQCINEIKRILKENGLLFSAHLTKYAFFKYIVANFPERINEYFENFINVFDKGIKLKSDGDNFTDNTFTENAEDVLKFMDNSGFINSEIISSEGLVDNIESKLIDLDVDKFLKIGELNYKICKDKYVLNAASHLLHKGINRK
jgi:ubiquinone/menaquinone biosynthesis C-methylase UbiE